MIIITAILDFLLMTWVFWPIILTLPFVAYYNVVNAVKNEESEVFSAFVIASIVGILAYKFPAVRGYFDGWRAWCVVLGGYITAGFLLSLYKWLVVLWDFRKQDVKGYIDAAKLDHQERKERVARSGFGSSSSVVEILRNHFSKCIVEEQSDMYSIYPNWKQYPIGLWWVYWPFFLMELPFDFIKRVVEKLFTWLRHFYNSVAKSFAVKG